MWSRVKINFWASANSQIQLGYFKVDNIQTIGSCNCALAYANINAPFAPTDSPVIRVFINGFDISSNSVQLSVSPTNLQGTRLSIKITVGASTGLRRIWLSWFAFSPSTASFGSYGGQVSQSKYIGSVSSDISNSLYQNSYSLYGLNLISLTNSQPLAFTATIDNSYVLTISASSTVPDFSLVYVTVGVLPAQVCSNCNAGLVANGADCVLACPVGSYSFAYKDGGVGCRTCSSLLGQILTAGKCVTATKTTMTVTTTTTISAAVANTTSAATQTSASSASTAQTAPIPVVAPAPASSSSTATQTSTASTASSTSASSSASSLSAATSSPHFAPVCPAHAHFFGNQCTCDAGYVYQNGACQLPLAPAAPVVLPSPSPASTSNSSSSSSSSSNTASSSSQSPPPPVSCGANSYDNGLGVCVCNTGSYFSNNACVVGAPCVANSHRNADGSCSCDTGFTNYTGTCSKCPQGALWSSSSSQCIFVCGQNSAYSASASACVCNPGFGLLGGSCQQCPNSYFISSGYCVTCPVNSAYNSATKNCDCLSGFYTNQWGVCAQKCGTNEVYNAATQSCSCIVGLGRINGACQLCPAGSSPTADGNACSTCKANEILVNGQCACQQGYAYNSGRVCTACASLPNAFLVNGICAVCPGSTIYNGNTCSCPQGKVAQGSLCISQCQNDELLDKQGNCYTCGLNQVIANGQCVCASGYSFNSCGVCVLSCSANQFAFQGACATCPLNTVFNTAINGCACPSGFYMDTYGVCQKLVLQAVTCASGQYFDSNNGCTACSSSCKTCKSATQCITCATAGYSANSQGVCTAVCGDGLIVASESCDTGSNYSAGCVGCQIQTGYACSGQPSVCQSTTPVQTPSTPSTPTTPVTPTAPAGAPGLSQLGSTNINSNNVFITLQTNPTFTFQNPTDMQNFIQSSFPNGPKPTVYCAQRNSPNLNLFDCLLIYPSGVPNGQFQVNFSYNYQGKSGSAVVNVNPLAIKANAVAASSNSNRIG
jgi:hypothetical protein